MVAIITKKPEETEYIGKRLAKLLSPGDIVCLTGELGAGKTLFVQGVAKGLGIKEAVTSPTFTIIQEYDDGKIPLYHMDVYRINNPLEMEDLGYEEYFYGQGITIIEWGNLIDRLLPEEILIIDFKRINEGRELNFRPVGKYYEKLIEELTGHDYPRN